MPDLISSKKLFGFVLAGALAVAGLPWASAGADEVKDSLVHKALLDRTQNFCNAVLPAWFDSENGVQDPKVRGLVADCYTGHARLSLLGVKTKISLAEASLSEVPAILLQHQTGIDLDIYRPLAGRTLRLEAKDQ